MKENFLRQMFSEADGRISSRRVIMALLALLFIGIYISNHVTGKNVDDTLKWQLFALLVWLIASIYGDKIPDIITSMKGWANAGAKPTDDIAAPK